MNTKSQFPIVCGTDFSGLAARAANVAAAVAARLHTPLLLVHGIDERGEVRASRWSFMMETLQPRMRDEAKRLRGLGTEVEEAMVGGAPDDGVACYAERANARLIVVASPLHGTLERWVGGSVSERIAETSRVPTLVLRDADRIEDWARGGRPLRVFVGADFSSHSDAAMKRAAELLEIGPCEFTVGYVDRFWEERADQALHAPPDTPRASEMQEMLTYELRQKAESFFPKLALKIRVLPASGSVDSHLLELAGEAGADLIVIGTHQWSGLSRLRHPSVSRRVLHAAQISVMCVPAQGIPSAAAISRLPAIRRVLVAADLSASDCGAVPYAFSMLPSGGAVSVLHVSKPWESPEPRLAWLRALLPMEAEQPEFKVKVEVVASEDIPTAICDAAQRFDADLICIGSHSFCQDAAAPLNSTGQALVARSTRPVLVIPQS